MPIGGSRARAAAVACLTAGLLPLIVAPSLPGCGCGAVGCQSGAILSVDFRDDLTLVDGPTATACFNDTCASSPLPTVISPGASVGLAFPDGSNVYGSMWAPDVNDRDRLEVRWTFPLGAPLRAGDRYRVTVTTSSGATLADKEATAVGYDEFQTCDFSCYTARFQ